jgi:hypothetical protein
MTRRTAQGTALPNLDDRDVLGAYFSSIAEYLS